MRHLAAALTALLAVTSTRADVVPWDYERASFGYEWTMESIDFVEGPAQVTLSPGGNGLTAEFGRAVATLTLAPAGTASVPLGDTTFTIQTPTVLPMAILSTGQLPQGFGDSQHLEARFTYRLRLTDLDLGEAVTFRFHGTLWGSDDIGTTFWIEYDHHNTGSPYLSNGRFYFATPTWGEQQWPVATASVHGHDPNVTVPGLPEPSSLLLMGLGGLGLLRWHRRPS